MSTSSTSFKPGNTAGSSTTFKPGVSANPGGRRGNPEAFAAFRDRCRALEPKALEALELKLAEGDLKAVELVFHYAWGKPPQPVSGEGGDGPPIYVIERRIIDPAAAPDAESV